MTSDNLGDFGASVDHYMEICDKIKALDREIAALKKEKAELEIVVLEGFSAAGVESVRRNGRACSMRTDRYPKKHADNDTVHHVLIENGYEELVKPTVNSVSLGALLRELADDDPDGELPSWCEGVLTLEPRYRATVTMR